MSYREPTVDDELTTWHEGQGTPLMYEPEFHKLHHRCPADMPPCPECQERDDDDSEAMR